MSSASFSLWNAGKPTQANTGQLQGLVPTVPMVSAADTNGGTQSAAAARQASDPAALAADAGGFTLLVDTDVSFAGASTKRNRSKAGSKVRHESCSGEYVGHMCFRWGQPALCFIARAWEHLCAIHSQTCDLPNTHHIHRHL